MVTKVFHIIIDIIFLAAISVGCWVLNPAAGLIVGGLAGLLLHYAVAAGNYDLESTE